MPPLLQRQIGVVPFRKCVPLSVRQRAAVCRRPGSHGSIQGCVRQRIGLYQILQCAALRERSGPVYWFPGGIAAFLQLTAVQCQPIEVFPRGDVLPVDHQQGLRFV